jgi:hypothetical protein
MSPLLHGVSSVDFPGLRSGNLVGAGRLPGGGDGYVAGEGDDHLPQRARKGGVVCYTCGCKLPYEDHGDPANIVEDDLKKAGQTETIKRAGVKQAKQNLLELIDIQKGRGDLENPKTDYNE